MGLPTRSREPRAHPAHLRAGALLALTAVAGALACRGDAGEAPHSRAPVTVEVMRVEPQLFVDTAVFSGQLDAEQSVSLRPEIEGVIEAIEFEQGQHVKQGDVLFRLRDSEQKAKLREAEANRNLAHARWKRAERLLQRKASSQAEADTARAEWQVARSRVEIERVELERTRVRAPFDGVVGLRHVDVGARVDEDTILTRIDAVDRLQLTFAISDEGLAFARPGMKVSAWVRPYPGEKFPGEVFFVSPSLDSSNRRLWVKAWIDNAEHRLAPGLFANVDLEVRRVEQALVLPESAVGVDLKGHYVWKVGDDARVSRLPVEVGVRERGVVEIRGGMAPGMRVVSAGINKVSEGTEIEPSETPLVGSLHSVTPEGALIGEGT